MRSVYCFALLGAFVLVACVEAYPTLQFVESIENAANQFPKEVADIEGIKNLNEKSARQFGFLNLLGTLNKLGNLGDLSNILNNAVLNGNTNNNGVQATTPRLNGRPGLGFVPDIPKGIDRILTGVAAGNLEQILEGSFVFAPTGVQKVAGTVLNRVFISTPAPVPGGTLAKTSGVPLKQGTTPVPSQEQTTLSSAEAQKQLQQIIKQQIQLQQLQAQLQQQANKLQNAQPKQGLKTEAEVPAVLVDRVAEMPIASTTPIGIPESVSTTEQAPDMWVRE